MRVDSRTATTARTSSAPPRLSTGLRSGSAVGGRRRTAGRHRPVDRVEVRDVPRPGRHPARGHEGGGEEGQRQQQESVDAGDRLALTDQHAERVGESAEDRAEQDRGDDQDQQPARTAGVGGAGGPAEQHDDDGLHGGAGAVLHDVGVHQRVAADRRRQEAVERAAFTGRGAGVRDPGDCCSNSSRRGLFFCGVAPATPSAQGRERSPVGPSPAIPAGLHRFHGRTSTPRCR